MLVFLQFQVAGHEVQPIHIGFADDIGERTALVIVADRAVNCVVALQIQLRLIAEQGRHGGLRVEVDGQHPITLER